MPMTVYDVRVEDGMGDRVMRGVPEAALKGEGTLSLTKFLGKGGDEEGSGSSDSAGGLPVIDLSSSGSDDEYLSKIDEIMDQLQNEEDLVIELDAVGAAIMAAYGLKNQGSTRYKLTQDSIPSLDSLADQLAKFAAGNASRRMGGKRSRREMDESLTPGQWAGAIIGGISVLGSIFGYFYNNNQESKRQAENQRELINVAREAAARGCEVEVETNSDAKQTAKAAANVEKQSGDVAADSAHGSKGRLVVRHCKDDTRTA